MHSSHSAHSSSKATEAAESSKASSEAKSIIMTKKVISLIASAALAFLTVVGLLLIHSLATEPKPSHHKVVIVIEEISKWIPATKEVPEYIFSMLETEVAITIEPTASKV
jgi:hypothetical protein